MVRLTKEQNELYNKYIISCISGEGYNKELKTDKEKLSFLYETFKSESGFLSCENINKLGIHKAFSDWISGLPSTFNIAFENYKIIELAERINKVKYSDKETDKILNNYFDFIANKTIKLMKKEKVIL